MELEVFVHGALYIAYSDRCLLSGYTTHRDSNQGACTNSCRWKYQAHEAKETIEGDIIAKAPGIQTFDPSDIGDTARINSSPIYLLQEQGRPSEYRPAYEDEHGTYIMNSKDLRAVQHVKRLIDIGVDSLKIKGRTKSYYYAARTAQVYRQAINNALTGKEFNMGLMNELEGMANRKYTEGFYRRHLPDEYQNYETGNSRSEKQLFVADLVSIDKEQSRIHFIAQNKFGINDKLTLLTPEGNIEISANDMQLSKNGNHCEEALGSGYKVSLPFNEVSHISETALLKGLLAKNVT